MLRTSLITSAAATLVYADVQAHINAPASDLATVETKTRSAQAIIEHFTGPLLMSTWDAFYGEFRGDEIELPWWHVTSVTNLRYLPVGGLETIADASIYETDLISWPPRLVLAYSQVWPTATLRTANAVICRFVAGWPTPADVPMDIFAALCLEAAHLYEHRESVVVGDSRMTASALELPRGVASLIAPYCKPGMV